MIQFFNKWNKQTPLYVQVILILVTAVLVSLFFPRQSGFKYKFQVGKTWKYDDLYAPYDFPLKKSDAQIEDSQGKVKRDFIPYFKYDSAAVHSSRNFLNSQLNSFSMSWSNESDSVRQDLNDMLNRLNDKADQQLTTIYDKGVISFDLDVIKKDSLPTIYLKKDNLLRLRDTRDFYRLQEARQLMSKLLEEGFLSIANQELSSILEQSVDINVRYDDELSEKFLDQDLANVSKVRGKVSKGDLIIRKGNMIDKETFLMLTSLKERFIAESDILGNTWEVYIGNLFFTLLIMSLFFFYLYYKRRTILAHFSELLFLLMWFWLFSYLVYAVENNESLSVYMLPFCVVPIVIKNFFNESIAFITLILLVLLTSFISSIGLDFAFVMVLGGLVAILIETETRYWTRFFYSISLVVASLFLGYLSISLIREGAFGSVNWNNYNWLIVNGVLTLLAYPLIPLLERIFNFTSSITLAELSDLNKPLLKKLSIKAPGTFQHSIQVANLAEAAATKIGANSLMVKAGALYHDIGKMNNPAYFIENVGATESLHNDLSCERSAEIILGHVSEGVVLAKQYKLPKVIIDFIKTHHGTTRVEYFYRQHLKECEEGEEHPEIFTYKGPRPRSKEQTILMLADSIEAASRTADLNSEELIYDFVDRMIYNKLKDRQLEHSSLTFDELESCRRVFKKLMKSIHHERIVYPVNEDTKKDK